VTLLRALMLLALIVWIGGIIFFAFVMAPILFAVLPTTKLAGDVVSPALSKLHWIGLVSGALFLICSLVYNWRRHAQIRLFAATHVFVLLMLALTAVSQFFITPRMREVRAQLEMVQKPGYEPYVAGSVPGLIALYSRQFNELHVWSMRCEGGVLFLGLGVVILIARKLSN
jgi:Domain of unknown function (DUF4149)